MSETVDTNNVLDDAKEVKAISVAGTTNSRQLAGSIAEEIRQGNDVALHAIGHQAIGQAVKAVPIANSFLVAQGMTLLILPSFADKQIPSEEDKSVTVTRTVVQMRLVKRRLGA